MARVGSSEVVVDGRGVAGGLPGVAHVVQADGPEHHLGRVMNGDTVLLELLKVGGKLVGRHATQGGLDGLVSDLVGRRGSGGGALIGAVDEDPVANEVVAIDRWEPRAGRRVRERGPGRVKIDRRSPSFRPASPTSTAIIAAIWDVSRSGRSSVRRARSTSLTTGRNPPWARLPIA